MVNTIFIVRHSERIDESKVAGEKAAWKTFVENDTSTRNKRDLQADPVLTRGGIAIALETAKSIAIILERMILKEGSKIQTTAAADLPNSTHDSTSTTCASLIECIYTSRLRRCVETAYPIALELNVPLVVCTGLALTALAVERRKGLFEFHSMEDIRNFCPGVDVISCDSDVNRRHQETLCCSCSRSSSSKYDDTSGGTACVFPTDSWFNALTNIAVRHPVTVIVAHRESIRNLASDVGLPGYGHTAVFHHTLNETRNKRAVEKTPTTMTLNSKAPTDSINTVFSFQYMLDESGERV